MATPTTLPATFVAGDVLTAAQQNGLRGAFRVLQVVHAKYAIEVNNSTSTLVDTGLTATITPQSATSKILVLVNQSGVGKNAGNANNSVGLALLRGATNISNWSLYAANTGTALQVIVGAQSTAFLDSPATTSATTYKTQFNNIGTSAASVFVQAVSSESNIVLMEISA